MDDEWAMIGSSAFRRRGLTFDGSCDVAFTEFDRVNGVSEKIKAFRKTVMASRLGIKKDTNDLTRYIMLDNPCQAFYHIREMLVEGGLGKIDRLWNGQTEGITYAEPDKIISDNLANPDGIEFLDKLKELTGVSQTILLSLKK